MFLWSNPTPDEATSAKLSAGYKVDAPSIGSLIAAILSAREAKSKADQQSMNDLIKGIGNAAGGVSQAYQQNQNQGQIADYLSLSRQAQASGTPGGESEAMLELEQQMNPQSRMDVEQYLMNQHPQTFTDPNSGAQFFRGQRGWQSVHGLGGASNGKVYDEQLGGYVTPAQSFNAERSRVAEIRKQLSEQENQFSDFGRYGEGSPNDYTGPAAHGYVQGDKGKLQYAEEGQAPTLISPTGDAMTGAPTMTVDTYKQLQQKAQDYKQLQEKEKGMSDHLVNRPQGGGGGDVNADVIRIREQYRAGKLTREEATKELNARGIY